MAPKECALCNRLFQKLSRHRKLKHYKCGNEVFYTETHLRTCEQTHIRISWPYVPQPSERKCKFGCDVKTANRWSPAKWDGHERLPHFRCHDCEKTYTTKSKSNHYGHNTSPCETLEGEVTGAQGSEISPNETPKSEITGAQVWHLLETGITAADLQRHMEPTIRRIVSQLMSEMRACEREITETHRLHDTTWQSHLRSCREEFGGALSFPRIGTYGEQEGADILFLTEEQAEAMAREKTFEGLLLICSSTDPVDEHHKLAGVLQDRYGSGEIEVQNMESEDGPTRRLPTKEVARRISADGKTLSNEELPMNCLNLGDITGGRPGFLSHSQFQFVPTLEARHSGTDPGKRKNQVRGGRPIDLFSSCAFTLCAERGTRSEWHCDVIPGTWVKNLHGIKCWPVVRLTEDMMAELAKNHDWAPPPDAVKFVTLFRGMTLVMGSGTLYYHAPFTAEPCVLSGGAFIDDRMLRTVLLNMAWIARNPHVTNEPIPLQLFHAWEVLASMVAADPSRYGFNDRSELECIRQEFEGVAACTCKSHAQCKSGCSCRKNLSLDFKCTPWCHAKQAGMAKKRRR